MMRHSIKKWLFLFSSFFTAFVLFLGLGGCIKHSVEIEEMTSAISYNDRFYDISVVDQSNIWVLGFYGKIIHSKDEGKTWSIQKSGTKDALTGVSFANVSKGWVISLNGKILYTSDGGVTWTYQNSGTENALMDVVFLNDTHGWIVGSNNTLLSTEDGGKEWRSCNLPGKTIEDANLGLIDLQESILNTVYFHDPKNGWIVGEYGTVYKTNDGGITWVSKNSGISLGNYLFDICFSDPQNGLIVAIGGRIFKTTDGGETWISYLSPTDNALYSISSANGEIWAVGTRGTLLTCSGDKWQNFNGHVLSLSWFREIRFVDKNQGWIVGGSGTILKTSNGGKDWIAMK